MIFSTVSVSWVWDDHPDNKSTQSISRLVVEKKDKCLKEIAILRTSKLEVLVMKLMYTEKNI